MRLNNRGLGVVVVVVVIAAIAAVGAAGYFVLRKGGEVASNAVANVVESAESKKAFDDCNKLYNDEVLCKALSNFVGTKQYQTKMSMSGMEYAIEIDGTKTYTKQTVGGKTLEIISDGNTTYTKDNTDGKWWKQVFPTTSSNTSDDLKFDTSFNETDAKTTYTKIGTEACDKLTCNKYKITETGNNDTQYVWFDTKDNLIRKWMVESKDGNTTVTYSYDKKSIDIPSNTKDATPTQSVVPMDFYSGMTGGSSGSSNEPTDSGSTDTSDMMNEEVLTEE